MTDTVDAVAQAIFIENSGPAVELAEYFEPCPDWDEVPEGTRDYYRRLAQAAIDALGLTEEWRCIGWVFTRDEEAAQKQHAANGREVQSRLVSGWVRKDNTNE
ncbi:hypothetical protein A9W98_17960 [Mycobacterium gordonae]|uniref:Uncharacterized protein n=1 Tax=Mycobacterium gordonae TaxID=1778 RepID=A0A1A6BI19_MYCGO|nr:hypothetical protein [Mycobacterium gordonae]OBS01869.1 hypothetical protein A9W98_17960 [Mycobacterium gordonae]